MIGSPERVKIRRSYKKDERSATILEDRGEKITKGPKFGQKGQILTIFGHFRGQKLFRPKFHLAVI